MASAESHGTQRATSGKSLVLELLDPMRGEAVQTWQFHDRNVITIGRAGDNDIALNDLQVSRHHAEIHFRGPDWELLSMGRHGTFLGDEVVDKAKLREGATLQFGPTGPKLRFRQQRPASDKETTIIYTGSDISELLNVDRERAAREAEEITKTPGFRRIQDLADEPRKPDKRSPSGQTKF